VNFRVRASFVTISNFTGIVQFKNLSYFFYSKFLTVTVISVVSGNLIAVKVILSLWNCYITISYFIGIV
jgi:hypothetical protein